MKQRKKVDFHLHSSASDGLFSPSELIKIAAQAGLAAAALTDHDTVSGLDEAEKAAKKYNLEFIPGLEVSGLEEGHEYHILGYYPLIGNDIVSLLEDMQQDRLKRMEQMVEKLQDKKFKISFEEVLNEAAGAAPGRLHLARILLKKKYVHTVNEAFLLYLGRDKPAFVQRQTLSLEQVMDLLNGVGAVPVLAHPGESGKIIIEKLIKLGLMGLEVYHPDHGKALTAYYSSLAAEKKLLITGGSDYHGESLHYPAYSLKDAVDYSYLEEMKKRVK